MSITTSSIFSASRAVKTFLDGAVWRAFVDTPQLESTIFNPAVNARDAKAFGWTIETAYTWLDQSYADSNSDVAGNMA